MLQLLFMIMNKHSLNITDYAEIKTDQETPCFEKSQKCSEKLISVVW